MRTPRIDATCFDAPHALRIACALRIAILVLCVAGALAGWLAGSTTVIGLAAVIFAEEMLEISVVIGALRLHPATPPPS
jgi:hypothetical protein